MTVAVLFTPAAKVEVDDAEEWYERRDAGLGGAFLEELEAVTRRVARDPEQFKVVRGAVPAQR